MNGVDDAQVTVNWREAPLRDPESAVLGSMCACDRAKHVDLVVTDPSAWVYCRDGVAGR
jgi:hypothetical protein